LTFVSVFDQHFAPQFAPLFCEIEWIGLILFFEILHNTARPRHALIAVFSRRPEATHPETKSAAPFGTALI
jgi:hypothetical protein